MRKAHYAALAGIIARQRSAAYQAAANARDSDKHESAVFNDGKAAALELLADSFARECSLDYGAFLVACGIKPH